MNGLRSSSESAYYGLTEYSDMTEDEFRTQTLLPDLPARGKKRNQRKGSLSQKKKINILGGKHVTAPYHWMHHSRHSDNRVRRATGLPLRFDWREKGVISPVRSQGTCGACWAFSTVEVAESMYAIKNGTLYPLSVQEVGRFQYFLLFTWKKNFLSFNRWSIALKTVTSDAKEGTYAVFSRGCCRRRLGYFKSQLTR